MPARQGPSQLRKAVEDALGLRLSEEELAILGGRLRFDDQPAVSQQTIANRLKRSQPHVSNVERALIEKLGRVAERREVQNARTEQTHVQYQALVKVVEALGQTLPPRRVRRLKRRPVR